MSGLTITETRPNEKSWLDRSLSLFTDVRAGEGMTAVLMLANIFLLLICYSVIKTVREPLILLGGGAEVRSYAAAGQAFLLMGFVPLYGWVASRVNRAKLLVTVTSFFIVCIELFAMAVAARVPYVGVAFFIWVGIFNMSLVAQFWSFANDIYRKEAGDRLFPIIMIGMTAGAPLGSFVAARLFRMGFTPQVILQVSALLLSISVALYLWINHRATARNTESGAALSAEGGFRLVMSNSYLRLIAFLVVLLNVVNTTGEYVVAKLLTNHVATLAAADAAFNKQAFIGAFSGDYQFWVNVTAFFLQAFVTSRLIKYRGLRGALLALPLIALGGYTIIAAGVGFSVVRWIKTAENATDYSIMNTARQLLWLPTTREEKYKAKQAIDTFFVRGGDVLSAAAVYVGTHVMHLTIQQFAMGNIIMTFIWLGIALRILNPGRRLFPRMSSFRPLTAGAAAAAVVVAIAAPASAQDTRESLQAAERAEKATQLHPFEPSTLERRLELANRMLASERPVYLFMGSIFDGGGFAVGPGYRTHFGDSGLLNAHAGWSINNTKAVDASVKLPSFAAGRMSVEMHGNWTDAPSVAFYGVGSDSSKENTFNYLYQATTLGATTRIQATKHVGFGVTFDGMSVKTETAVGSTRVVASLAPTYRRTGMFAEYDSRTAPEYSRRGGLYRVELSDYAQANAGNDSFRRLDAEVQQFVPLLRENWVLAFRAAASTTETASGQDVPYSMMPDLGGSHELRGFSARRFKDRHSMVMTGEYRWTAGPLVDMAVFVDAGKVTSRRADLNFRNLEVSHGIGVRIHTPSSTITRIELARSREGNRLIFAFSPSF